MNQKKRNQKPKVDQESLVKYNQNLASAKPETPSCQKTLGYVHKVGEFGAFFREHAGDLRIVMAQKLMEFAETQVFTPEEYAAYKFGLNDMNAFFNECFKESTSQKTKTLDEI